MSTIHVLQRFQRVNLLQKAWNCAESCCCKRSNCNGCLLGAIYTTNCSYSS